MKNNHILRSLRYTFSLNDARMLQLFDQKVSTEQINKWLLKEDDEQFEPINDKNLAVFLNMFIEQKRGKKEGEPTPTETQLTNNIILRKLKIALNLKDEDMLQIFALADIKVGKHELSALFRNPNQGQYRECKDQFLRNFLYGLTKKYKK